MRHVKALLGLTLLALTALLLAPVAGYGLAAYVSIVNSDVDKIWRKVQGPLATGYNFMVPEFRWIRQFTETDLPASLRTMEFPVDIAEDRNITNLPEGGREADPTTVNAYDALVAFIHKNGRFTLSKRAQAAMSADGSRAYIKNQLVWSGKKKMEAVARTLGDEFYGFSTGTLAQVDDAGAALSGATSHTITLKNAYGSTLIAGTTTAQKAYIANLFRVGDKVALIDGSSLVTNSAAGTITAVSATTPSITVTWGGSVDPDDGDKVVFSNGANGTTIDHTNYGRHLVGLLDMMTTDSVQGIAGSSYPNWTAALADTAGGRFNGSRWRKGLDTIRNDGKEDASVMTLVSNGVNRDVILQTSAGLRFDDAMNMEIDGEVKARGKGFKTSKRVPPGMALMFDQSAIVRKTIFDDVSKGGSPRWPDGKDAIDDSYRIFSLDWIGYLAVLNRKCLAYWSGLTEA